MNTLQCLGLLTAHVSTKQSVKDKTVACQELRLGWELLTLEPRQLFRGIHAGKNTSCSPAKTSSLPVTHQLTRNRHQFKRQHDEMKYGWDPTQQALKVGSLPQPQHSVVDGFKNYGSKDFCDFTSLSELEYSASFRTYDLLEMTAWDTDVFSSTT